jgi:class 3 adenylate cyclase
MTDEPLARHSDQRRLAAILAADVAGCSRLMGKDEAQTSRDLKAVPCGAFDHRQRHDRGHLQLGREAEDGKNKSRVEIHQIRRLMVSPTLGMAGSSAVRSRRGKPRSRWRPMTRRTGRNSLFSRQCRPVRQGVGVGLMGHRAQPSRRSASSAFASPPPRKESRNTPLRSEWRLCRGLRSFPRRLLYGRYPPEGEVAGSNSVRSLSTRSRRLG